MRWNIALAGLFSLFLFGWLSSGSCTISYTSNPCTANCNVCDPNCACYHGPCQGVAPISAFSLRLEAFDREVTVDDHDEITSRFTHILGLSAQRALDSAELDAHGLARFSAAVLDVNSDILAISVARDARRLESADAFQDSSVVTFSETLDGRERGLITLLYDRRGNLLEIDVQHRR